LDTLADAQCELGGKTMLQTALLQTALLQTALLQL
jgi:hypothetical protein